MFQNIKKLEILRLPPNSTKDIMPLDVYFLRMWKGFIRKISDRIILDEIPIELRLRDNILKLQSLVHNQFSSPMYKEFIMFSWFKSGYTEEPPEKFLNPIQYCFSFFEKECQISNCEEEAILKCSWCKKLICIYHFFENYHYCTQFVE